MIQFYIAYKSRQERAKAKEAPKSLALSNLRYLIEPNLMYSHIVEGVVYYCSSHYDILRYVEISKENLITQNLVDCRRMRNQRVPGPFSSSHSKMEEGKDRVIFAGCVGGEN